MRIGGCDITRGEYLLEGFRDTVNDAREDYDKARGKYIEAMKSGNFWDNIIEAIDYLNDAYDHIRDGNDILKGLIESLRESKDGGPKIGVLIVGDSITGGVISGGGTIPYEEYLRQSLGDKFVVNRASCGGTTSVDWNSENPRFCGQGNLVTPNFFKGYILPHLPSKYVSVMFGGNDATGFYEPTPVETLVYAANIAGLVEKPHTNSGETVILMTPPPRCMSVDPNITQRLFEYVNIISVLCDYYDYVECGPDVYNLLNTTVHFYNCNVHPNQLGHQVIGESLADFIKELEA